MSNHEHDMAGCIECECLSTPASARTPCTCPTSSAAPPVARYKLTVTIRGNTHDEIVSELLTMTRGGYLLASDYYKRDEFDTTGGRGRMVLEHTNLEMTSERYKAELHAWVDARRETRKAADK